MRPHLTVEQRQLAPRLKARGLSLREIGPQVGCSHQGVALMVRHASRRPVRHHGWVPGPGRLMLADREEITIGLQTGQSFTRIAARLGKAVSTVSREVAGNGGREQYRAWRAYQRAREQARRPKTPKLACPQLAAQVAAWLEGWWSPVQNPADGALRRHHQPLPGPRSGLAQHLQPDPARSPPRMLPAHLRHRSLHHISDLARRRARAVRAVSQPGQLIGQIPGHPPVQRRPVHSHPGSYLSNLSAIQDRANRVQALLDNRQDNQCQSGLPSPTPRGNVAPEWPEQGHCRRSPGRRMSHVSRRRTPVCPVCLAPLDVRRIGSA
jgi:Helix-turn-helix domain